MNLFALRAPILQRLRAQLPPEVAVLSAVSIERLIYGTQVAPAVYLIYTGGTLPEVRAGGGTLRLSQTWSAVAIARDVGDGQSGGPAQDAAGELAGRVLDALSGYTPNGARGPMTPAGTPYAGQNPESTTQLVPVEFRVELWIKPEPA